MLDIDLQADDAQELAELQATLNWGLEIHSLDRTLAGWQVNVLVPAGLPVKDEVYRRPFKDGRDFVAAKMTVTELA